MTKAPSFYPRYPPLRKQYIKKKEVISPMYFLVKENEDQRPYYLMLKVPVDSLEDSFYDRRKDNCKT